MAADVIPQVLVFQELDFVPDADIRRQPAHISGGHAKLIRYDDADEKDDGSLGFYNPSLEECFSWPNRPAGATVDLNYTEVHIDDALLKYFEDFIGAGDTIQTVAGSKNKVRADNTNFVANGTTWPRDADLKERDVQVGDIAKVRAVVGGDTFTLWTFVSGVEADVVAAIVNAATSDTDNAATQPAPTPTETYTGDDDVRNCVDITAIDQSAYDGLLDGDINETYTITVLEGSVGGDATTAKLRVTSASGNDDVAEVTPAAFGSPTTIGTRGALVTFDDENTSACSLSADNNNISDVDFIPGQQWEVSVGQAFTAPVPTSGGTYTGDEDTTYIIEVTKGGLYADEPEITVTTDKGIDGSGPTKVTAAATAVAVGTKGVTVEFDGAGLRKGDRYFISVVAESDGAIKTLVFGHNFDETVQNNGATEVDLTLFIKKDIEVSEKRANVPGQKNWTQSSTEICLEAGITALDSSWTDGGVPEPLPVISESSQNYGEVFVNVRYWLADLCDELTAVSSTSELNSAISGPNHPDNPLRYAVGKALANSNGAPVWFTSVCDPDDEDQWETVLNKLDGRDEVYGLVPLTKTKTILSSFEQHVNNQSTPEFASWRTLWTNLEGVPTKSIVTSETSTDGEVVLAVLEDDPNTSGTQYTLLSVPAGNSNFVTNGVKPKDIVRYLFQTDSFGEVTWTEFVVDAVLNETTLRLVAPGHTAAVNTAQKMEVWRNLSSSEQAEEQAKTNGFDNRRVMAVWPDEVGDGGLTFEGYHLCAALAGLASGVVPHRSLTRTSISGFDDVSRTTSMFNRTELITMKSGGVWIVTQDPRSGSIFTLHALTTDVSTLDTQEEMLTRNFDNISFFWMDTFKPYIGVSNAVDSLIAVLRSEIFAGRELLRSRNFTPQLGGQMIDMTVTRLQRSATQKDRIIAVFSMELPFALNNFELHLQV